MFKRMKTQYKIAEIITRMRLNNSKAENFLCSKSGGLGKATAMKLSSYKAASAVGRAYASVFTALFMVGAEANNNGDQLAMDYLSDVVLEAFNQVMTDDGEYFNGHDQRLIEDLHIALEVCCAY